MQLSVLPRLKHNHNRWCRLNLSALTRRGQFGQHAGRRLLQVKNLTSITVGSVQTLRKLNRRTWYGSTPPKKRAMRDIPRAASVPPLAVTAFHHQTQLSQKFLLLCLSKLYRLAILECICYKLSSCHSDARFFVFNEWLLGFDQL